MTKIVRTPAITIGEEFELTMDEEMIRLSSNIDEFSHIRPLAFRGTKMEGPQTKKVKLVELIDPSTKAHSVALGVEHAKKFLLHYNNKPVGGEWWPAFIHRFPTVPDEWIFKSIVLAGSLWSCSGRKGEEDWKFYLKLHKKREDSTVWSGGISSVYSHCICRTSLWLVESV